MVCGTAAVAMLVLDWFAPQMLGMRLENFVGLPLIIGLGALIAFTCLQVGQKKLRVMMFIGAALSALAVIVLGVSWLPEVTNGPPLWSYDTNHGILITGWMMMLWAIVLAHWGLLSLLPMKRVSGVVVRFMAQALAALSVIVISLLMCSAFFDWMDQISALVVALIGAHIIALLCGLAARRMGWKPSVALRLALLAYLLGLVAMMYWGSPFFSGLMRTSPYYRPWYAMEQLIVTMALATLLASGAAPVLAYFEWLAQRAQPGSMLVAKVMVQIVCPRCRTTQSMHTGGDRCAGCGLHVHVQIEEPRCECGYLLYQLHEGHCPECGKKIAAVPSASERAP
jgi:hypothetical protein